MPQRNNLLTGSRWNQSNFIRFSGRAACFFHYTLREMRTSIRYLGFLKHFHIEKNKGFIDIAVNNLFASDGELDVPKIFDQAYTPELVPIDLLPVIFVSPYRRSCSVFLFSVIFSIRTFPSPY